MDLKCPHCGWRYNPASNHGTNPDPHTKVPTHDFPKLCRAVCPGSGQEPRKLADTRPLLKEHE